MLTKQAYALFNGNDDMATVSRVMPPSLALLIFIIMLFDVPLAHSVLVVLLVFNMLYTYAVIIASSIFWFHKTLPKNEAAKQPNSMSAKLNSELFARKTMFLRDLFFLVPFNLLACVLSLGLIALLKHPNNIGASHLELITMGFLVIAYMAAFGAMLLIAAVNLKKAWLDQAVASGERVYT